MTGVPQTRIISARSSRRWVLVVGRGFLGTRSTRWEVLEEERDRLRLGMIFFERWFSSRKPKEGGPSVTSGLGAERQAGTGTPAVQWLIGTAGVYVWIKGLAFGVP